MSKDDEAAHSGKDSVVSEQDLKSAIDKLEGKDLLGVVGEYGGMIAGATGGAAAAATVASAAGASTILGSSALGSALGGVFVASTPVGWVVGCAIAGAAGAYGLSKALKSGEKNNRIREEIKERLNSRLKSVKSKNDELKILSEIGKHLDQAVELKLMPEEQANRMIDLIDAGKLDANLALDRLQRLLAETIPPTGLDETKHPSSGATSSSLDKEDDGLLNIARQKLRETANYASSLTDQAATKMEHMAESAPEYIHSAMETADMLGKKASAETKRVGEATTSSLRKLGKLFKDRL